MNQEDRRIRARIPLLRERRVEVYVLSDKLIIFA